MTADPGRTPPPGHPGSGPARRKSKEPQEDTRPRHLAHTWEEARQAAFDCAHADPAWSGSAAAGAGQDTGRGHHRAPGHAALRLLCHGRLGSQRKRSMDSGRSRAAAGTAPGQPHRDRRTDIRQVPRQCSAAKAPCWQLTRTAFRSCDLGGTARPGEPRNGQHIRKAGEEAASGEVLVKAGVTLNPAHLAVAALAGHDELLVQGKPVVKLLLTGSEVVAQGLPCPGQGPRHLRPAACCRRGACWGAFPAGQEKIGDSYDEWLAALEDGPAVAVPDAPAGGAGPALLPADVVITTGGTGRSGHRPPPPRRGGTGRPSGHRRHRHAARASCRPGRTAGRAFCPGAARQPVGGHDGPVHRGGPAAGGVGSRRHAGRAGGSHAGPASTPIPAGRA